MVEIASICACGEFFEVTDEGELCLVPGSVGLRQVMNITAAGASQFVKADYPWLSRVFVRVQGAGGGSGAAHAAANQAVSRPGGAGGGYSEGLFAAADLGAVETVVVGTGGTGGTGNDAGTAGTGSSFGGLLLANGGDGGSANMPSGDTPNTSNGVAGPSAAGAGSALRVGGGAGQGAIRFSGVLAMAGMGGDSQMGTGGFGRSTSGPGSTPRGYGGGAGGACSFDGDAQNGGPGGDGCVVVELYA